MTGKLCELGIKESLEGLKRKEISSYELVSSCISQIEALDNDIHAFITLTKEEALKQAKDCDEVIADTNGAVFNDKPLFGIPYACKDNYCTKGIKTTAGSRILDDFIPPYESTVTKRLQSAGAILLGKTNMDAFAHGSSTETSDFFPTKNPHDLTRSPGGSSGGSAAAVASNMCIFATGSETAGSIRGPASWCGITGLKPSYGRVSRYGVIAMASSTDSPGPLTKNVSDAAIVLKVIAGKDPFDATSSPRELDNYVLREKSDLKGVSVGYSQSYLNVVADENEKEIINRAIHKFEELGAKIIEIDLLDPKYAIAVYTILQRSEVSSNLARYDGIRFGQTRDHFGFEAKKRMMLGAYTLSAGYYDAYYATAQRVRTLILNDFEQAFQKVDFIIGPTMPSVALPLGLKNIQDAMFGENMDVLAEPAAIAGLTALSIPCGKDKNNLPVGLQIIGRQFSEKSILNAGEMFQEVTDYHLEKALGIENL